jgi:ATP adenylyltransferase
MHRPAFILHTNEFALQTSDLDASDFSAAWSVLNAFAVPQVLAYNCGVEAGASQGHKHLQVFPRPEPLDFQMFPDKMELSQGAFILE